MLRSIQGEYVVKTKKAQRKIRFFFSVPKGALKTLCQNKKRTKKMCVCYGMGLLTSGQRTLWMRIKIGKHWLPIPTASKWAVRPKAESKHKYYFNPYEYIAGSHSTGHCGSAMQYCFASAHDSWYSSMVYGMLYWFSFIKFASILPVESSLLFVLCAIRRIDCSVLKYIGVCGFLSSYSCFSFALRVLLFLFLFDFGVSLRL